MPVDAVEFKTRKDQGFGDPSEMNLLQNHRNANTGFGRNASYNRLEATMGGKKLKRHSSGPFHDMDRRGSRSPVKTNGVPPTGFMKSASPDRTAKHRLPHTPLDESQLSLTVNGLATAFPRNTRRNPMKSPYFEAKPSKPEQRTMASQRQFNALANNIAPPQTSDRMSDAFKTTDGLQRGSTQNDQFENLSSDELEGPANVTNHPEVQLNFPATKRNLSKSASPEKFALNNGLEISNIKSQNFSKKQLPKRKSRRAFESEDSSDGARDARQEENYRWSCEVTAVNVPGEPSIRRISNVGLVQSPNGEYWLKANGGPFQMKPYRNYIDPKKLQKCKWEIDGHKIRLEHSTTTDTTDNILELELGTPKQVCDLAMRFNVMPSVTVDGFDAAKMERIFEKSRETRILEMSKTNTQQIPEDLQLMAENKRRRDTIDMRKAEPSGVKAASSRLNSMLDRTSRDYQRRATGPGLADDQLSGKGVKQSTGTALLQKVREDQLGHNPHLRRSTRNSGLPLQFYQDLYDEQLEPKVEKYSKTHGLGSRWSKPLSYPKTGKKKATVEWEDLERLDEGEFLNDNLISFYLRFLEHQLETERPDVARRVYFFNSFFYERLTALQKGQKGINYEGVQKWTRTIDLFAYDVVIVPINELTHWYVAVICNLSALNRKIDPLEEPISPADGMDAVTSKISNVESAKITSEQVPPSPAKETTESFAEMSLESRERRQRTGHGSPTDGIDLEQTKTHLPEEVKEDDEMLDVPDKSEEGGLNLDADAATVAEHQQESLDLSSKDKQQEPLRKKQKRKSAPIMHRDPDLPAIITFDSLGAPHSQTVKVLKQYLFEEAKSKKSGMELDESQIRGITAKDIPQQSNYSDCGPYMLGYVEKLLSKDPREFISKIIKRKYDIKTDWPHMNPNEIRASMRDQLQRLHKEQVNERREMAKKAGKYSPGSRRDKDKDEELVDGAQQAPENKVKDERPPPAADKPSTDPPAPEPTRDTALREESWEGLDDEALPTSASKALDKPNSNISVPESVIVLDGNSQANKKQSAEQAEEPPSSQPMSNTTPRNFLPSHHTRSSSSTTPNEIPESQSQPQEPPALPKRPRESSPVATKPHSPSRQIAAELQSLRTVPSTDVELVHTTPLRSTRGRGRPSSAARSAEGNGSALSPVKTKTEVPAVRKREIINLD